MSIRIELLPWLGLESANETMREFSFPIREALLNGLRRDSRLSINQPWMTTQLNVKPVKDVGVVNPNPPADPISSAEYAANSVTFAFPFPKLIRGKGVTLLADATALFDVDESTWDLSAITTYDSDDPFVAKSVVTGGDWHFVDLFSNWLLFNGSCVVTKLNDRGMFGAANRVLVNDTVTVQTGCENRGRIVLGGFNVANSHKSQWEAFWKDWANRQSTGINMSIGLGTNFVAWSSIGDGDVLWLLNPFRGIEGDVKSATHDIFSIDRPLIFDKLQRNEMGFMPMPWQGTVRRVKPLGKAVVVYGDDGIGALVPVTEPISTYGYQHIMSVGIADRGAVGGDDRTHVFLDNKGTMWALGTDLTPQRLGYSEYFSAYPGDDVTIGYDPEESEFYLSNDAGCYVLTGAGLSSLGRMYSSIFWADGALRGVWTGTAAAEAEDTALLAVSDVFDMKMRGIKRIHEVEIPCDDTTGITVGFDYRFDKSAASFTRSTLVPINKEGNAAQSVSGVDFKLVLSATDYTKVNIDGDIIVRYQTSDVRTRRGLGAPAITA